MNKFKSIFHKLFTKNFQSQRAEAESIAIQAGGNVDVSIIVI